MSDGQELTRLANEYTSVRVLLTEGPRSSRLIVRSDRTGDETSLDPTTLEAIASMSTQGLAALVEAFTDSETADTAIAALRSGAGEAGAG